MTPLDKMLSVRIGKLKPGALVWQDFAYFTASHHYHQISEVSFSWFFQKENTWKGIALGFGSYIPNEYGNGAIYVDECWIEFDDGFSNIGASI